MELPQSGISRYETEMNSYLPDGIHFSDEEHGYQTDKKITAIEVKYYCAQIQLRITLNSIHNALYKSDARSEYMPLPAADLLVPVLQQRLTTARITTADSERPDGQPGGMAIHDPGKSSRDGVGRKRLDHLGHQRSSHEGQILWRQSHHQQADLGCCSARRLVHDIHSAIGISSPWPRSSITANLANSSPQTPFDGHAAARKLRGLASSFRDSLREWLETRHPRRRQRLYPGGHSKYYRL
jgi:hypothetical protein